MPTVVDISVLVIDVVYRVSKTQLQVGENIILQPRGLWVKAGIVIIYVNPHPADHGYCRF